MTQIPADIMEKAEAVQRASLGRGIRQSIELIAKAIAEERKAVDKAKADADLCAKEWQAEIAANNILRAQLREAVDALNFYAAPEIYKPHPHGPAFDRRDVSFRAQSALKKMEEFTYDRK